MLLLFICSGSFGFSSSPFAISSRLAMMLSRLSSSSAMGSPDLWQDETVRSLRMSLKDLSISEKSCSRLRVLPSSVARPESLLPPCLLFIGPLAISG